MFAHYYAKDAAKNVTMCRKVVDPSRVKSTADTCPACLVAVRAECKLVRTLGNMGIRTEVKHSNG